MRNLNKRCFLILAFLFCAYLTCLAQVSSKSVSGIVTDEKGIALSGVTVSVKGTNITVISDKDGKYAITLPEKSKKLVFSYVGMQSEEMIAAKSGSQNISLKSSAGMLSDFVVVGYGTVRKKDLTGAVGSIKSDQITQVATTDVVQAMQGRIAGVQVIANSGEPGSGAQIRIRGIGSINGSDPIYVVDGYQTGDISFLAPGDIESIDVLKDASATAIYGSRGANGVVLVTTKKGKKGPVKFVVDSYVGNQKAWRTIPMVNATEYANLVLQGYANDGNPLDTSSQLYTRLNYVRQNNYHGTNWQDEVMQSGLCKIIH